MVINNECRKSTLFQYKKPGPQGQVRVQWLCRMKCKDSKPEARNPKQYLMTKIQMIQTIDVSEIVNMILFLSLGNLIFDFVSNFDIRISNFANDFCVHHALWA